MKNAISLPLASGWMITAIVDSDQHLNIYIENTESDSIYEIETGQGDGENGEQLALRFTTETIEEKDAQ